MIEISGHLKPFDLQTTALIEAAVLFFTVEDHLVAALLLCVLHAELDEQFPETETTGGLVNDDVLNMSNLSKAMKKFLF